MKLPKFISITIVTMFALWASNAKAIVIEQFTEINFSLIAAQQVILTPRVLEDTIKTSKITNKALLNYLATAINTNWPAGAQLALRGSDIYVVDKTGTNAVFDLTVGMNVGDSNVVYFSVDYDATLTYSDKSESIKKKMNRRFPGRQLNSGRFSFISSMNRMESPTRTFVLMVSM
jgi:hypothetical protein